jgi:biotin carboxyl carrier protein
MKLTLAMDGQDREIEILAPAPDCRFAYAGAPERAAHVMMAEPCVYSVLMDGFSYEARVEERPGHLAVVIDGRRFEIAVRDPRRWSRSGGKRAGEGPLSVTSPMPGKIVRVLVAVGDEVRAGQGLVVVEAMKMQNELKAPRDAKVIALPAKETATVAAGEVLAILE